MNPNVSIIILNWNGWKDTIECLESIYQVDYSNYNVIVIDNGSEDESVEKINEYCNGKLVLISEFFKYTMKNKPIKISEYTENKLDFEKGENNEELLPNRKLILIKNDKNYGFAEGNNIGIDFVLNHLNTDYILFLNNDTVVDKDFLIEMVKVAVSDDKIGAIGPKIYYYNYNGHKDVISFAGEKINFYTSRGKRFGLKEVDRGQHDKIKQTDKIEGCCMLIKKNVVEIVGGFDPVYFAYWEETDLCMRIKNAGFKLIYVPKAHIWHKVGVSWDNYFSYFIIYHYLVRNRLIFMWRYATNFQKIVFSGFFILYLLVNIVMMFVKEDLGTSKEGLRAIKNSIHDFMKI